MSLILLLIITIRIVPYTCLRCKSVCPSVCHKSTFYQNGYADHHATITTCYQRDSTRVAGTAGSYTTLRSSWWLQMSDVAWSVCVCAWNVSLNVPASPVSLQNGCTAAAMQAGCRYRYSRSLFFWLPKISVKFQWSQFQRERKMYADVVRD